ncbi:MAG: hypothetical protein RSA22_03165 [Acinetobacter sp.]|jgi:hypothetical protein
MNRDAAYDPISYLEMKFGQFINDSQLLEHRRVNFIAFCEIVAALENCAVYKDDEEFNKALRMRERLKLLLDVQLD